MELDLLIAGGSVVTPTAVISADIGITAGCIVELAPQLSRPARERIDATGKLIFPGVIDSHVHFNQPGRTEWEGFTTGSAALAAGGGTCFIEMPLNASPPTLDAASFQLKAVAALADSHTDFALWGGLTPRNLERLDELAECGVIGFKAFMSNSGIDDFQACDDESLLRGLEIAARLKLPVAVHAESETLTAALTAAAVAAGRTTVRDYLDSRPVVAELDAIQRMLLFARETGCRVHVVHISHPRGVELLREYSRTFGVDATCETCPHYLLLNEGDMLTQGAPAKCAPPLRTADAAAELLSAVNNDLIDTIGSDHSPAPAEMKTDTDFFRVWGGISGVQLTLRALLTMRLEPARIARLTADQVASRFALPDKGRIAVGYDADVTIVDSTYSAPLTRDELFDRHRISPYLGKIFRGRIERTLLRGQAIFADNTLRRIPVKLIGPRR